MNKLMQQLRDPTEIHGRERELKVDWNNRKIRFDRRFTCYDKYGHTIVITPVFYIDTKPTEWGNDPIVTSPYVNNYPALGHTNHLYNNHSLCLGHNLARLDLHELLRQIEKWFGGFYEWTQTGVFPQSALVYS